jgi:uncharacterized protein (DUF2147 family)
VAEDVSTLVANVVIAAGIFFVTGNSFASESVVGFWRASDDRNKLVSIIELYLVDSKLNGRIVSITNSRGERLTPVCERCKGDLNNKVIIGQRFISDLKRRDLKWVDGEVVDVRPGIGQGTVAHCELELVDGKVKLTGYVLFGLVRGTAIWDRVALNSKVER